MVEVAQEQIPKKAPFVFKRLNKQEIIALQLEAVVAQEHLAAQSLDNFDVNQVSPLNPEIISRQATINIGTIGHVAHGKSTLVRSVSGTNVSTSPRVLLTSIHAVDCSSLQRETEKHHY